ncbi:hypothetical protein QYM36_002017 [Artemia franciscana]|uniref:ABC1 atypical kinase-like domain-containing protein n=1 Tax=Artemia franciscana TaxID=6661 RepID=A0AA88IAK1_ARTSF|nr:hypothetical protein QYM36_002017 [Artemia franciscana]
MTTCSHAQPFHVFQLQFALTMRLATISDFRFRCSRHRGLITLVPESGSTNENGRNAIFPFLVRKAANKKAELVLLDHGLYEELPSQVRKMLCSLWKSIVLNDHKGMRKYSAQLGVPDDYRLFCMAVSQRFVPHDKSSKTADIFELMLDKAGPKDSFRTDWNKMSPEKKAELRGFMEDMHDKVLNHNIFAEMLLQRPLPSSIGVVSSLHDVLSSTETIYMEEMAKQRFDQITKALKTMPRTMLLVLRNINTVRAITKDHGGPVDRYRLMARSATRGAFVEENAPILQKLRGYWQQFVFDWKIIFYIFCWLKSALQGLPSSVGSTELLDQLDQVGINR